MTPKQIREDAEELGIDEVLYLKWFTVNDFILKFIPAKSSHKIVQEDNSHKIGDFTIFIVFMNNSFLVLNITKGDKDLLTMRLPDRDLSTKDMTVVCTHILLILESY